MSHWRDRFRTAAKVSVTEVKKDDFTGKEEGLLEDESVFLVTTLQAVMSSAQLSTKGRSRMFALSFEGGDRVLLTPGEETDDLFLYALSPRGGIEKVTATQAVDKLDLLVPNMPFSSSKCCATCSKRFDAGDSVFSIMYPDKPRKDFCRLHIRLAMKYNSEGALAYSFQAADDLDRADPVAIWNMMTHVPQTLAVMDHVVKDVFAYAKKIARRGRLSKEWLAQYETVVASQQATLRVLKFAGRRVLDAQRRSLEEMTKTD